MTICCGPETCGEGCLLSQVSRQATFHDNWNPEAICGKAKVYFTPVSLTVTILDAKNMCVGGCFAESWCVHVWIGFTEVCQNSQQPLGKPGWQAGYPWRESTLGEYQKLSKRSAGAIVLCCKCLWSAGTIVLCCKCLWQEVAFGRQGIRQWCDLEAIPA